MEKLRKALDAKYPGKFTVAQNDAAALQKFSPSKNWRRGAFEVVRTDTGEVLYSKLGTNSHLVDSDKARGGNHSSFSLTGRVPAPTPLDAPAHAAGPCSAGQVLNPFLDGLAKLL